MKRQTKKQMEKQSKKPGHRHIVLPFPAWVRKFASTAVITPAIAVVMVVIMTAVLTVTGCKAVGLNLAGNIGHEADIDDNSSPYMPEFSEIDMEKYGITSVRHGLFAHERIFFVGKTEILVRIKADGAEVFLPGTATSAKIDRLSQELAEGESWRCDYADNIFSMKPDGTDLRRLEDFQPAAIPAGREGGGEIISLSAGPDGGFYIAENVYWYKMENSDDGISAKGGSFADDSSPATAPALPDSGTATIVRKLSKTGAEVLTFDFSEIEAAAIAEQGYFHFGSITADGAGRLYLQSDRAVSVFAPHGEILFSIKADHSFSNLITLANGMVAVVSEEETGLQLKTIDPDSQSLAKSAPLPQEFHALYGGIKGYDLTWSDDLAFFGFHMETGESLLLFNWLNCGINNYNLSLVVPLPNGQVTGISAIWDGERNQTEFLALTRRSPDNQPQKTVLTFGFQDLDISLRPVITDFNRYNADYRIEVQKGLQYDNLVNASSNGENGAIPDILSLTGISPSRLAADGLLENLWPYIEKDTALGGRPALFSPVFDVLSKGGGLFEIASGFSLETVILPADLAGDISDWNPDTLGAIYQNLPEGSELLRMDMTKSEALSLMCRINLDSLAGRQEGKGHFQTKEFVNLLRFANEFPEFFDWDKYFDEHRDEPVYQDFERMADGRQLGTAVSLSDFTTLSVYERTLPGGAALTGYPTGGKTSNAFELHTVLAMNSSSQSKEGAWQFMRTILTEEYQQKDLRAFPTNHSCFTMKMQEAMTPNTYTDPDTGQSLTAFKERYQTVSGKVVEIPAATAAETSKLLEAINATTQISSWDDALFEIISKECISCFAGESTAEQTAERIQEKVNGFLYP